MAETFHVVPVATHEALVEAAYTARGFAADEARAAARLATAATTHGIRTHNAIKALHLDDMFGSKAGGCVPRATIRRLPGRFDAAEVWDAGRKLGQAVAWEAIETCIGLADRHGTGTVSVDNAFHYLWGGGYVMEAARRGYIAYTNCTASLAEVVPFQGAFPTLGTNPHSWGFPTTAAVGFPVVIDWATSVIAMGRVEQLKREGKALPAHAAVDRQGNPTTDPDAVAALVPFGEHKGYGLALACDILAGVVGGAGSIQPGNPRDRGIVNGMLSIAIDPARFAGGSGGEADYDALMDYVKGCAAIDPATPVMVAGDPERRTREERLREGVPVDAGTWTQLAELAATLDVATPAEA